MRSASPSGYRLPVTSGAIGPEEGHIVWRELSIRRDQRETFRLRLEDKHVVERVAMMPRERAGSCGVVKAHRELDEPGSEHAIDKGLVQR